VPEVWLRFLHDLWGDDKQTTSTLQEVFGYVIGGDTRQQKIFLIVGPKRSGKGTIARVLTGILGRHNVAAPTLAGIATNFGLQPLIDKPLGIVSDARLSGKTDRSIVVERLLSISGEDSITVDRKYRDPWTGRLPTRFLILTNELPKLMDSSGALASRFIVHQPSIRPRRTLVRMRRCGHARGLDKPS
jgi:putative DNA primase/helicase